MINRLTKMDIKMMKEDYVSPEVKFVEAIVEKKKGKTAELN